MESNDLEQLIRSGQIGTRFAPVLDTYTGMLGGYEVVPFVRDRDGECAEQLRTAIQSSDHTGDLDSSIRGIGLRDAERLGLPAHTRLFFSTEPESLVTLEEQTDESRRSMILKLAPASIQANPAAVMRSIRSARQMGWEVGIRNVGVDLASMAFVPLVNPSVLSLHPTVMQIEDREYLAKLIWLLQSHLERTSAVVMARGVRDERDLNLAEQLGARLITGPRAGEEMENPLPSTEHTDDYLADHYTRNKQVQGTPYSIGKGLQRDPLVTPQELVVEEMRALMTRAVFAGKQAVVVTVFAEDTQVPEALYGPLVELAGSAGLTAAVSGGFAEAPAPEIRSGPIDSSDALRNEYAVIVVGADWSAMLAAHRLASPGFEGREEYETFITTDRFACVDAARTVLSRLAAQR